jgi:stearoyl-CoA desaturase (delta-9 desaturase)
MLSPESKAMNPLTRRVNMAAVIIPFAAFVAAVAFLPASIVGWQDLAILAVMYVVTGLGVTVGYHRLFTHNAFAAKKPLRYGLAVAGTMAVEGPVIEWVADHRKHHAHTDKEGDPHSPHVGHGEGWRAGLRGLAHAHTGWLWRTQGGAAKHRYAPDLLDDPGIRRIHRLFLPIVIAGLLIPAAAGWALSGEVQGALTGFLWGGLVRVFLVHHVTWSINSVCHYLGRRRFDIEDESTNVGWLALPSFGESWHHNHHAFPRSASHGLRWYEIDTSALVIRAFEKLGLAYNVVRIAPERQAAKLAE